MFPNARNEKPTTILTKIYFSEVKKALTSNSQVRCFFFGAFEPTSDLAAGLVPPGKPWAVHIIYLQQNEKKKNIKDNFRLGQ